MSLEKEIERGRRAKILLENELFVEALALIRENIHREFENSKSMDKEGREDCYRQLKATNEIERHIISVMNTGEMAKKQKEEQTRLEKFTSWVNKNRA